MPIEISNRTLTRLCIQCGCAFNPLVSEADLELLSALAKKVVQKDRRLFNQYKVGRNSFVPNSILFFQRTVTLPKVGQIQHHPFVVTANAIELGLIYRLPEVPQLPLDSGAYPDPTGFNPLALDLIQSFMETMTDFDVIRVGKVYQCHFGPFGPGEAIQWLAETFAKINVPDGVGELASETVVLLFVKDGHNINLQVQVERLADGRELVAVRLDINNRDNTVAMDLPAAREILNFASSYYGDQFWKLFAGDRQ